MNNFSYSQQNHDGTEFPFPSFFLHHLVRIKKFTSRSTRYTHSIQKPMSVFKRLMKIEVLPFLRKEEKTGTVN